MITNVGKKILGFNTCICYNQGVSPRLSPEIRLLGLEISTNLGQRKASDCDIELFEALRGKIFESEQIDRTAEVLMQQRLVVDDVYS